MAELIRQKNPSALFVSRSYLVLPSFLILLLHLLLLLFFLPVHTSPPRLFFQDTWEGEGKRNEVGSGDLEGGEGGYCETKTHTHTHTHTPKHTGKRRDGDRLRGAPGL